MTTCTFSHKDLLTQQNLFLFLDNDVILLNRAGIKRPLATLIFHSLSIRCSERNSSIMVIIYPRSCSTFGKTLWNRSSYSRHRKYCGKTTVPIPCPFCESTLKRKDDLSKHNKHFHSEKAKRKAEENTELLRPELLNSEKIPRLSNDEQIGGAVNTRGMKKDLESAKKDLNPMKEKQQAVKRKLEDDDDLDMSHLMDDGLDDFLVERANRLELYEYPLFKANLTFLPYKRQGLKGAVKKEQFSVMFDQLRKATEEESLGDGLSESLFEVVGDTILKLNLPDSTKVHLTFTSKKHSNGTVNSGFLSHVKYGIPVKEFVKRGDYVHAMFKSLARKMNSA